MVSDTDDIFYINQNSSVENFCSGCLHDVDMHAHVNNFAKINENEYQHSLDETIR